jgi:chitin disaccharide deacetylase
MYAACNNLAPFMSSDNKIIINADDFGYNIAINKAILRSFQSILITDTSLMVNMPGFEDAIQLARTQRFLSKKIGLHLNLTEGYPLSEGIRKCGRFCDGSGLFIYRRKQPLFFLGTREQKAIYMEMNAQMEKMIQAGIIPNHLDSHHHVHTEWAIMKLLIRLGKEYNVRKIRLTRNMGKQQGYSKRVYKYFLNGYLKYAGITGTNYFGDIDDMREMMRARPPKGKTIEIMVHPCLDERQELVDYDRKNLQEKLIPLIDQRQTISYTDL